MKTEEFHEVLLGATAVHAYLISGFGGLFLLQHLRQLSSSELLHPSLGLGLWATTVISAGLLFVRCVRGLDGVQRKRSASLDAPACPQPADVAGA
jgi:hypothetical protein